MEFSQLKGLSPHQTTTLQAHHNYTDVNALNALKETAREDQEAALRPVAEQFEALFVQQILKESRKVSFDDGWLDGNQGDFYKDWSDKQLSLTLSSKGTLGFADNLVKQLLPTISKTANAPEPTSSEGMSAASLVNTDSQPQLSTEQMLSLRAATRK
ncbi:MAG: flagellar biosynthesis [Gammaproteobacteria bacterium]|nr:flagellar biosynthesis [Gammaproteobacteria bacterium]